LLGFESCGCFGRIEVDPWYTLFLVDIPFFLLLLIFRPKGEKLLPPPWPHPFHALGLAVPVIGFMAVSTPILVGLRPEFKKPEEWASVKPVRPVIVSPVPIETVEDPADVENAGGTAEEAALEESGDVPPLWPWLEHIDIAEQLESGIAVILMYHHDCPTCAEMVPLYSEYCAELRDRGEKALQIAFIAAPPFREPGPVPEDTVCLRGKLSESEKWAIMSPYVVALIDGAFVRDWPQGTAPLPETLLDEIFEDH